jgi:PAT family beta-lactamase induction signal transducer AmpG
MSQYGWRIGSVAAGGVALVVASRAGWEAGYIACAVFALPAMAVGLWLGEPARRRETMPRRGFRAVAESIVSPLTEFLRRRGALLVLLFVLMHKVGDTLANLTFRLLFEDLNYSNDEIALYDVGFGFWAYLAGIFLGGMLYTRLGMKRAVMLSLWLMAISNLSFAGLAVLGKSDFGMAASIGFENLASGIGGVAVVAYFSALCDLRYTAAQYALITAAMSVVGRVLTGATAGALIESLGYAGFYVLTAVIALPGIVLFWLLMRAGFADDVASAPPARLAGESPAEPPADALYSRSR